MEFSNTTMTRAMRGLLLGGSLLAVAACSDGMGRPLNLDFDLRGIGGNGFSTADAAREARATRPTPDARGVISYPTYQVAVARPGDTLTVLASRVGLPEAEIARYNGLNAGSQLREGEVVALPRRTTAPGGVDVTAVAGGALDRIGPNQTASSTPAASQSGAEPLRHQVVSGETAYSIARLYGVSVRSLAEWNGLDSALSVRQGQYLMIPPKTAATAAPDTNSAPGVGTPTPLPPSSSAPLPQGSNRAASEGPADTPASPNMGAQRTSSAAMTMPADGRITGAYVKGKSDGIDIAAAAGSPVKAAQGGTVAAITRDTDQVPILVIRHADNLLTVYAGIDNISVAKGATVSRGQTIAQVRASDSPALHFQVRQGTSSVDPMQYLN
ncbi:MAG: peptidoglycan DD-metalloendopeptidase family protein [Pseudomonadota bacterium]|nr:peptidoglycan DD-metalloendopeptidase family protein [Pseudomonadota bacterium]